MEQAVTYTFPGTDESLRLIIGTANTLEYGRYEALRWEAAQWFGQETGVDPLALTDDAPAPDVARAQKVLEVGLHRAYMLAVLRGVLWQQEAEGPWLAGELPESWQTVPGFAEQVPAPLYLAWREAARACNPGLWWVDLSEAGKAAGGVSVTTLTTASRL